MIAKTNPQSELFVVYDVASEEFFNEFFHSIEAAKAAANNAGAHDDEAEYDIYSVTLLCTGRASKKLTWNDNVKK